LREERSLLIVKLPGAPPELWALQKSAEQRLGHYDKDAWKTGKFIWHSKFQCSEFLPLKTSKNTQNSLHNYRLVCVLQYKALGGNLLIALGKVPEASDLDLVVFWLFLFLFFRNLWN